MKPEEIQELKENLYFISKDIHRYKAPDLLYEIEPKEAQYLLSLLERKEVTDEEIEKASIEAISTFPVDEATDQHGIGFRRGAKYVRKQITGI